jgi:hypothetical protein
MGTKAKPGQYDCYVRLLLDEPHLVLAARSPEFAPTVQFFADRRQQRVDCGDAPPEDGDLVVEARKVAAEGPEWRRGNMGRWRGNTFRSIREPVVMPHTTLQGIADLARAQVLWEIDLAFRERGVQSLAISDLLDNLRAHPPSIVELCTNTTKTPMPE